MAFVTEVLTFSVVYEVGLAVIFATGLSILAGIAMHLTLQATWVFGKNRPGLLAILPRYGAGFVMNWLFSTAAISSLIDFGLLPTVSKIVVTGVWAPIGFVLAREWVYRRDVNFMGRKIKK
jgi:putative flippase GtrA